MQQDIGVSQVMPKTVHIGTADRHGPTLSSQQTGLCLSDVLESLFESQLEVSAANAIPSPQTIQENVKQEWGM